MRGSVPNTARKMFLKAFLHERFEKNGGRKTNKCSENELIASYEVV